MLRDERTGIPRLDAGPLPERLDGHDGFFHGDGTLEVRRVGLSLGHEFHQPLGLFRSHCGGNTLVQCTDKFQSRGRGNIYGRQSDPLPPLPGSC